MGTFTQIPQDTFEELKMDAGVLLTSFDPSNPTLVNENIITATTGGINVTCVPTYSDFGEDVDNCPNNTKELKHLDSWDCGLSTTALGTSPELIKLQLGAADIDGTNQSLIKPRRDLAQTDFAHLWWVGDKVGGGFVAVKILNALSDGGFSLQTTKNGKGTNSLSIKGHVSIEDQDTIPMEFYSTEATSTENTNTENTNTGNTGTGV